MPGFLTSRAPLPEHPCVTNSQRLAPTALLTAALLGCAPPPPAAPAPPDPRPTPVKLARTLSCAASSPPPRRDPHPDVRPYALTISGGLSQGAYEAGINWALVRGLRAHTRKAGRKLGHGHTELVAATGASAGNINAVLTAIAWCQRDEVPDAVDDNPFAHAWLNVGIESLLPGWMTCEEFKKRFDPELTCAKGEHAYRPGDGAFAGRALLVAERRVKKLIREPGRFDPACRFPVGVTVTSEHNAWLDSAGSDGEGDASVKVPTQLHSVTFRAEGAPEGLLMRQWLTARDPAFPPTLYVADQPDGLIGPDALLDVVEASSAFPVAFGMKTLSFCDPRKGDDARECEPGRGGARRSARFFDGGVYDNIPLGLTMSLLDPPAMCARGPEAPWEHRDGVRYLFLDPDTTRREKRHEVTSASTKDGVPLLVDLLQRFVGVSRKYELQSVIRHSLSSRPGSSVAPITRLAPIMSEQGSAFGGFFARPFRQYDYAVGVYDGLFALAERACADLAPGPPAAEEPLRCVARETRRLHDLLGLDAPREPVQAVSYVVRRLLRREVSVALSSDERADALLASLPSPRGTARDWVSEGSADEMTRVLVAENLAIDAEIRDVEKPRRDLAFSDLLRVVAALKAPVARRLAEEKTKGPPAGLLDYRLTDSDQKFFADPGTWFWHRTARLTERLAQAAKTGGDETTRTVFGAANFLVHEVGTPEAGWVDWNASTISNCPDCGGTWVRILPYEVTVPRTGGLEIGYRWNVYAGPHLGLTIPVRPWSWIEDERRHVAKVGLGPILPTGNILLLNSLDATFNLELAYEPGTRGTRAAWSAEVGTNHLLRHVRLALTLDGMPFGKLDTRFDQRVNFRFGFADLPSLVYWLAR